MHLIEVSAAVAMAFAAPPKVTVGRETTYITKPLRADGMVDYLAYVNLPLNQCKPEENAAALLQNLMGAKQSDKSTANAQNRPGGAKSGGRKRSLVDLDELIRRNGLDVNGLADTFDTCRRRPWKAAEQPLLAELLNLNEAPLTVVVEASRKPKLLAQLKAEGDPPLLMQCRFEMVDVCRTAARLLALRAMRHAGAGKVQVAYDDVEAVHRLAALLGAPPRSIIECIAACSLRDYALQAEQALAFIAGRSADKLRRRGATVAAMKPPADLIESFDHWERLTILDATASSMLYGGKAFGDAKPPAFDIVTTDESLRTINQWYDKFTQAMRKRPGDPGPTVSTLEDELSAITRRNRERKNTFFLFRDAAPAHPRGPKAAAGQAYAETMLAALLPAFGAFQRPALRTVANTRRTVLAYAIAAYRIEHGRYPDALNAAQLRLPPETLLDPFTQTPMLYLVKKGKRLIVGADARNSRFPSGDEVYADKAVDHVLELP